MGRSRRRNGFNVISKLAVLGLLTISCNKHLPYEGKVVFTHVPAQSISDDRLESQDFKYISGMTIAMADMSESLKGIEILTSDFQSARAPEISYDGKTMVLSAQKAVGDPWQIWTMSLENNEFFQVTDNKTNCTDPTWLPDGDIVFSKMVNDKNALKYHALFAIGSGGCCERRITFQPHEDVSAAVLHDGRILVASKQIYPEVRSYKYLALRPDGTKTEVFHLAGLSSGSMSKASEDTEGNVLFAEAGALTSVKFSRPLHTKNTVISREKAKINSIFSMADGRMLTSVKNPSEHTFGITIFNLSDLNKTDLYFNDSSYHAIEAVMVQERPRPKILPSGVNLELDYGYFFCMNTDASQIEATGETAKVQVLGMNGLLGEAPVEEDGSFYLELSADKPIRYQTLDVQGQILRGPSSWMWVRPNERRGCVGCHQDGEIAPENVVPRAMQKAPFAITDKG